MKVNSSSGAIGYSPFVREKEGDSPSFQQEHRGKQNPEKQAKNQSENQPENQPENQKDEKQSEAVEATPEKVDQAVEAFKADLQAQANGLNASVEGTGPGLKVVLKDGMGGVIRQFTGEEFLQLRKAASKDGRIRGKILDQKL